MDGGEAGRWMAMRGGWRGGSGNCAPPAPSHHARRRLPTLLLLLPHVSREREQHWPRSSPLICLPHVLVGSVPHKPSFDASHYPQREEQQRPLHLARRPDHHHLALTVPVPRRKDCTGRRARRPDKKAAQRGKRRREKGREGGRDEFIR